MEVGRSCIELNLKDYSILLDCGVKVNRTVEVPNLPEQREVKYLFLSHAHLDHSGFVPRANEKLGFESIYATELTFETSHILQKDLIKVAEKRNTPLPYTYDSIDQSVGKEVFLEYNKSVEIEGCVATLFDAGHIPGSSMILFENLDDLSLMYTGDIKLIETQLQRPAAINKLPKIDVLITESTYGDRTHPNRKTLEQEFIDKVITILDKGGNVIVPAFAVGRAQEMMILLRDVPYPVYLDGMARDITRLYLQYPSYIKDYNLLKKAASAANWIRDERDRKKAIREASVIITPAGMLNGGPALSYIKKLRNDKKSAVFLTGYQVEHTNGRLLLEEGYVIDEKNSKINVKMQVSFFDFSAHAGKNSLKRMVQKLKPEKIIVVHGEEEKSMSLANDLIDSGYKVYVPKVGDSINLSKND